MGTCPTPCDTSKDGVCVILGTDKKCHDVKVLDELRIIIANADKVLLTPDDKIFTVEAVEKLISTTKGLKLSQRSDGVIEILKSE